MKKWMTLIFVMVAGFARGQSPVSWNFSANKVADNYFEVHLTANVQGPWHIYSQTTPEGGPVPTSITLNKNPLVELKGNAKEIGKLQQKHEEVFGVDVKYFDGKVDFVQIISLRRNVKTTITGTITFMMCNDQQCLPPATVNFSIPLQ